MATKLLKSMAFPVIFLSMFLNFCTPSISLHHHHSLPKSHHQNVRQNRNSLYSFRTTFIETGKTTPVGELDWRSDAAENVIEFRLRTAVIRSLSTSSREWIALGMAKNESLIDTDLFVIWLHGDRIEAKDFWTDSSGRLHKDKSQDYRLLDYDVTSDDRLELVFSRPIDTCDAKDYQIQNGTDHLLLLRGYYKEAQSDDESLIIHNLTTFAMKRVSLMKTLRAVPDLPSDVQIDEVLVDTITVPAESTTYWCKVYQFSRMYSKHHIIRYEAVVSPGNEDLVHHMEVYNCNVQDGQHLPNYSGSCRAKDKPSSLESCKHVIGAWAMGAEPFIYPEEVGVAIGGSGSTAYVMIEIHYNNPTHRKGVVDNSGIRFYHTPTLRPNDAGILEVGVVYSPNQSVPPNSREFVLTGYCTSQCTKSGLPTGGIRAFASQLHTHLTGVAVWTEHIRRGVELKELNRDNHYSAHFQEIRLLPTDVQILPGDMLITHCRYDTRSRNNVTLGGFGIEDEMCVNYIHYYPQSNLEVCKSTVSKKTLDAFLRHEGLGGAPPEEGLDQVRWDGRTKKLWQDVIQMAPIDTECLQSSGRPFLGDWKNQSPVSKWLPRPKRRRYCHSMDWRHLLSRTFLVK
ncbi:dopamine beta-hydroxylase-like [Amphiura filiformis]|uniref:dopamine beta-hydroxylase-like n=1 Tax=Amphiura filiformis TaxID=82378 RepID=UPI003B216829